MRCRPAEAQTYAFLTGDVSFRGFLGKFFLAKPRSSSGYAIAADKKQLRLGAGMLFQVHATTQLVLHCMSYIITFAFTQAAVYDYTCANPTIVSLTNCSLSDLL